MKSKAPGRAPRLATAFQHGCSTCEEPRDQAAFFDPSAPCIHGSNCVSVPVPAQSSLLQGLCGAPEHMMGLAGSAAWHEGEVVRDGGFCGGCLIFPVQSELYQ